MNVLGIFYIQYKPLYFIQQYTVQKVYSSKEYLLIKSAKTKWFHVKIERRSLLNIQHYYIVSIDKKMCSLFVFNFYVKCNECLLVFVILVLMYINL